LATAADKNYRHAATSTRVQPRVRGDAQVHVVVTNPKPCGSTTVSHRIPPSVPVAEAGAGAAPFDLYTALLNVVVPVCSQLPVILWPTLTRAVLPE
jgi:hypothetical protein